MSIRSTIKNQFWQVNYVLPFARKYKNSERGKTEIAKQLFQAYRTIKPISANSTGAATKKLLSQVDITIDINSSFVYFLDTSKTIAIPGNVLSNFTLDYDKIIHGTFKELVERAKGDDEYGMEVKLLAEGIECFVQRIIDALKTSSVPHRERLISYFDRMLTTKADHFDEALQRILFFNQVLWQTRHRLNGLGRLDVLLDDIFEKDLKDGIVTKNDVRKSVRHFLKSIAKYPNYKSDALLGDIGQIIILGGLNPDGNYFCNELTRIFMQEQANLALPDPKILLRTSQMMPDNLIEIVTDCLCAKTGSPLLSNDDIVIKALVDSGIDQQDAYSYCVSACWEPLIVGKSIAQNNIGALDYFLALDKVLDEEVSTFDDLLLKYIKYNQEVFKVQLKKMDSIKWAKDPLVSLFMDGSAEKRVDISDGGCEYPNYGMTTVALSNVVDSLLNIRSEVFEKKEIALQELNAKRKSNFINDESYYVYVRGLGKSFGHDKEDVIELVNRITSSISDVAEKYRNPLNGTVKFGLSSPDYNMLGKSAAADLSGRKVGMPYNTHISCVDAPYTEVVNFASQLDYDRQRYNGNVIDFFVSPNLIEDNKKKFVQFLKASIKTGFFQMQMNVLDSKTLINAKAHPDKYKSLIVRVWGFSSYFNDLPDSYKDLMIERAMAAEKLL